MSKPGPKPAWDNQLETVLRHWPYLPKHVKRTFAECSSHYGPEPLKIKFPTPSGATWGDVEIVLLSPHEAEIKVHEVIQRYGFAAIGLADGRNSERPRAEWRMLVTYAENPIASNARLASAPPAAIASISARGVLCQVRSQRSLHQPHSLSSPPRKVTGAL
jgi:hypothetical protein